MIDLSVIAAGGPIVLGVAVGLIGRRGIRALDVRRAQRHAARRRTHTPRPVHARARTAR